MKKYIVVLIVLGILSLFLVGCYNWNWLDELWNIIWIQITQTPPPLIYLTPTP